MTIFTGGPRRRRTQFLSEFEPSTGLVMETFASDALNFSPTLSILRAQEQTDAQRGVLTGGGMAGGIFDPLADELREPPTTDVVTVEEQGALIEERFEGQFPITPKEGMRRATLELLMDRKEEEVARAQVIARATTGQLVAGFGVGVLASIIDPLGVATAFVPVIGPAKYAGMLARQTSRTGRALVRARIGALEGTVGAALVEPFISAQARSEQADYTMADSLLNIAFGTVLGGGMHMGIGAISDARKAGRNPVPTGKVAEQLASMSSAEREDFFSALVALSVEDKGVVAPFRLTDIIGNPRIADAGLTDPGAPVKARFEFDSETVVDNRTIPADIDADARATSPGLFKLVDEVRGEQASLREQVDRVGGDRAKTDEIIALDRELLELRNRLPTLNKRKAKLAQAKIAKIEKERAAIVKENLGVETPVLQKLRERVAIADEKLRELAPEVTAEYGRAENRVREQGAEVQAKATGIKFDEAALTNLHSVENLRLADTNFTAKVDDEILPDNAFSTLADAEEGLRFERERLDDTLGQMNEDMRADAETLRDAELETVAADIEADDAYAKGLRALAMCATGRGR